MRGIEIDKLKACQLDILKELDRVCEEIGIQYCLAFGSCLGAVRHHGFIPWDDDIDVYISADDLEKLKINAHAFKKPFFLQTRETDINYGLMIARVRNSNTTLIEETEKDRDINHGVFIDIYPLFHCPSSGANLQYLRIISMVYRLMLYGVTPKNRGKVMKIGSRVLLQMTNKKAKRHIADFCYHKLLSQKRTGYLSTFYGDESNISYPEAWFFPVSRVPFEDMFSFIPRNADNYLKATYGDYMVLPPEEKRTMHHAYAVVDTERAYLDYKGVYYCQEK